jgi:hypothetical protein
MNKSESLKRAAECTRLAEATSDPDMQAYLLKLGLSWMRVAVEPDQRPHEEDRRLKTPCRLRAGTLRRHCPNPFPPPNAAPSRSAS